MKRFLLSAFVLFCALITVVNTSIAQTSAFTYQGSLANNGAATTGSYDFVFALFNVPSGSSAIGGPITNLTVGVTNGLFAVTLDFGGNFPGEDRWLEISVRSTGGGSYTTLNPRQRVTSAPYAITAANLSGSLPAVQLTGTVPPAAVGSFTNHSDVVVTSLQPGQSLAFSVSAWTNGVVSPTGNGMLVTLSYSGTNVPVNAAMGTTFRLLATNNFLLQNPTGTSDGQRLIFEIIQDATGGRTMALGSAFKLGTDLPLVFLTTNANRRDFLTCVNSGTNVFVVGFVKGY
jgi:hypothetical protein